MKLTFQIALLFFVCLGVVTSAYSDPMPFNVNVGWSSMQSCNSAYMADDCEGVYALFEEHPIPIGAIDEENGREIVGWQIVCEDAFIMDVGNTDSAPGDSRIVPRGFGWIRLHYRAAAPPR